MKLKLNKFILLNIYFCCFLFLGNTQVAEKKKSFLSLGQIYQNPLLAAQKNRNEKIAKLKYQFIKKYEVNKKVYVIEDSPLLQSHQLRKPFIQMSFEDQYFSILKNYYLQLK